MFNFVHSSQSSWPLLSMQHAVLNEFFMTEEINASTNHHPTALITTCHHQRQGPNYTFSCGAIVVQAQDTWVGHRSDSPVLTFWKLDFPWTDMVLHPQVSNCQISDFSNPSWWNMPIAAVASDFIATWPQKQKPFEIDCSHIPSVAALTSAANSNSPLL